jgi:hypothetical protein
MWKRYTDALRPVLTLSSAAVLGLSSPANAVTLIAPEVSALHAGNIEHCDAVVAGRTFTETFECGDELFGTTFNVIDGVGINVGDGGRFTRVPRADLTGTGQWNRNVPARVTGPNAQSCADCHNFPVEDGAGLINSNVIRDPQRGNAPNRFIQRNTPQVLALGGLQRLAEEINEELLDDESDAIRRACPRDTSQRHSVTRNLDAKGVSFGTIEVSVTRRSSRCPASVKRNVAGIDSDLRPKPFQWKGVEPFVRSFNRGAAHNELGMQPVELTGDNVDGDGDGVVNEMTIADMTALAVYLAAQPRPVTQIELDLLRQTLNAMGAAGQAEAILLALPTLTTAQKNAIANGSNKFVQAQCATCHKPSLLVDDPIFSEPSQNKNYRDAVFPAGQSPVSRGLDPARPITFHIRDDPPDNVIQVNGAVVARLGGFKQDSSGRTIIPLFGDLKRHNMGPGLAENIDEQGFGAAVWMTAELWGVGSTAPYLHDGRASTLTEAILAHDGDAAASRAAFRALSTADKADLIAFLNNLVLFRAPD